MTRVYAAPTAMRAIAMLSSLLGVALYNTPEFRQMVQLAVGKVPATTIEPLALATAEGTKPVRVFVCRVMAQLNVHYS
jgi:hypothetical protein